MRCVPAQITFLGVKPYYEPRDLLDLLRRSLWLATIAGPTHNHDAYVGNIDMCKSLNIIKMLLLVLCGEADVLKGSYHISSLWLSPIFIWACGSAHKAPEGINALCGVRIVTASKSHGVKRCSSAVLLILDTDCCGSHVTFVLTVVYEKDPQQSWPQRVSHGSCK